MAASCASLAGLVLCFIACFILLVMAPYLSNPRPTVAEIRRNATVADKRGRSPGMDRPTVIQRVLLYISVVSTGDTGTRGPETGESSRIGGESLSPKTGRCRSRGWSVAVRTHWYLDTIYVFGRHGG